MREAKLYDERISEAQAHLSSSNEEQESLRTQMQSCVEDKLQLTKSVASLRMKRDRAMAQAEASIKVRQEGMLGWPTEGTGQRSLPKPPPGALSFVPRNAPPLPIQEDTRPTATDAGSQRPATEESATTSAADVSRGSAMGMCQEVWNKVIGPVTAPTGIPATTPRNAPPGKTLEGSVKGPKAGNNPEGWQ